MNFSLKILLSAYACEPGKGSEPDVGWQWALHLGQLHDVTVITRANNRQSIENALAKLPLGIRHPNFIYHEVSPPLLRLKKWLGVRWYYKIWQKTLGHRISAVLSDNSFDIMQHLTFASYRYPTAFDDINCEWILGPVGGAEFVPWIFLPRRPGKALCYEIGRNLSILWDQSRLRFGSFKKEQCCRILVSTHETAEFFNSAAIPTKLMPTIGIDCGHWALKHQDNSSTHLKLLYVGSLVYLKGLHWLLESLKFWTDSSVSLSIVGDGPEKKHLNHLVEKWNLRTRVHFVGAVRRSDLVSIYHHHDVFVFPSLHDSGGIAVLEAMASGLAIICLKRGGPALSVTTDCGFPIDADNPRMVVRKITEAISNYLVSPELARKHGTVARNRVRTNYDWSEKAQKLSSMYHEFLQTKS